MVSTGAFALAIFAIVYITFEGLYFYSDTPNVQHLVKAAATSIPFLVYAAFYFSAYWKDDVCVSDGDIIDLFGIAFSFSGAAVVFFLLGCMLTSVHALLYSSICIIAIAFKSTDDLCDLKPEFQVFPVICCALAMVSFVKVTKDEFQL